MPPGFWLQVEELWRAARNRPPNQRSAYLDQACGGDGRLRRAVESLMAESGSGALIEATALEPLPDRETTGDADELPEGGRIGPYRLLSLLGRGGMGAVYLAARDDDQYQKLVAIKVVKRGKDTEEIVRRFKHERQIVANLDHPYIARLFDGGSTNTGVPYFVMEYVDGEPIDRYCEARGLRVHDRLRLFGKVLSAVQHAHQNLVVHRDLKPGNILVTAEGTPKLLDFGIAKLLRLEAGATQTLISEWVMTPEYASPEQVRGDPITTGSDVYSLGVVLYELLAGHRPYQVRGLPPEEMYRVVCHQESPRPSLDLTVVGGRAAPGFAPAVLAERRRQLRGDLDNVILMALRKEPERRYRSVEQFAEDLRRHLDGQPVIARRDTIGYRAGKFVGRHKVAVAAAVLSVFSLVAGTVVAAWQAHRARVEFARAERRFGDVRRLAHSFLFEIHDSIQDLAGSTRARELLVRRGLEYLDSLAQEATGDEVLQAELAAAYVKVGDVQGRPGYANLGDRKGALASYRKAAALYQEVASRRPGDRRVEQELASAQDRLGDTLRTAGDSAQALASYRHALALRTRLLAADAGGVEARRDLASSHQRIADMLAATGDAKGAIASQRLAMALFERLEAEVPADPRIRRDLFIGEVKVGDRLGEGRDGAGALASYRKALALAQALSAADPANARARRELAAALDKVGNALSMAGEAGEALAHFRGALAIRHVLAAADPQNAEFKRDLSISHEKIGLSLFEQADYPGALTTFRQCLALDREALARDPADTQARLDISTTLEYVGNTLASMDRLNDARSTYDEARTIREVASSADLANTDVRQSLAGLYARLGELEALRSARARPGSGGERWGEAKGWFERARGILLDLEARGLIPQNRADEPARLAKEIARCERRAAGERAE